MEIKGNDSLVSSLIIHICQVYKGKVHIYNGAPRFSAALLVYKSITPCQRSSPFCVDPISNKPDVRYLSCDNGFCVDN